MVNIQNIFEEEEEVIYERFSFVVLVMIVYYAIAYYGIAGLPFSKVHFVLIVLALHVVQIAFVYKFWCEGQTMIMWAIVILPMFLYLFAIKYRQHMKKKKASQMNQMLYQMQQGKQPKMNSLYNQDTSTTGVQNALMKSQAQPSPTTIPTLHAQNAQNYYAAPQQQMGPQVNAYGDYVTQFNAQNATPFASNNLNPFSSMSPF